MGRSAAFARIRAEVLALAGRIPHGRVATYAELGRYLDVMPRHVAYLLATLRPDEAERVPWHRVVGAGGDLGIAKGGLRGEAQVERLRAEGVAVHAGRIDPLQERFYVFRGARPIPRAVPRDAPVGFAGNKRALPSKPCASCGRVMTWRRRWARSWDQVRWCSDRCRRAR